VLFATAEDPIREVWRPRLEAAGADLGKVHYVKLANGPDDERGLVLPNDVKALGTDLARQPVRLLVVDPLGAHLSEKTSAHVDTSVRQALAPLARLADTHRCAVLGVMHLNKNEMARGLARVGGSIAFVAAARSVLVWGNDPDCEPIDDKRVLGHLKCNVGRRRPSLGYRLEAVVLASGIETSRVAFTGESAHAAEDLLTAQDSGDVKSFLNDFLADGPRATKDVMAEAQEAGFSRDQLKAARKRLGVTARRVGGTGADGCWVLDLPGRQESGKTKGAKGVSHPDSPLRADRVPAETNGHDPDAELERLTTKWGDDPFGGAS
jgi:hypothetical protein